VSTKAGIEPDSSRAPKVIVAGDSNSAAVAKMAMTGGTAGFTQAHVAEPAPHEQLDGWDRVEHASDQDRQPTTRSGAVPGR
jgi:hypothetical protein